MFIYIYLVVCTEGIIQAQQKKNLDTKYLTHDYQFNFTFDEKTLPFKKRKIYIGELDLIHLDNNMITNSGHCELMPNLKKEENKPSIKRKYSSTTYNPNRIKQPVNSKNINEIEQSTFTYHKTLSKKLEDQILEWDKKDNNKKTTSYVLQGNNTMEILAFNNSKKTINKLFSAFCAACKMHFDKIYYEVKNIPQMKDQLHFFKICFEYLEKILGKKLNYKTESKKIIALYNTLPQRMKILKEEYLIVERFEVFKFNISKQYTNNNEIKVSLQEISQNLQKLFNSIQQIKYSSAKITKNLNELILNNN
ncbi:uncharacterized protein VNE69_12034 [Vairimorpha necatrix]|uniref:Uncharacterized protein n=1 Tax=Vairimorpha necatrix TaxID=6039 RepID=A0AAX4JGG3_9MICR